MRLYLSSFDIGAAASRLPALARGGRRAAIILNALDHRDGARAQWLAAQTQKLSALGFVVQELDLRQYFGASAALKTVLQHLDLVWINGGNAFLLRRAMKQSGFDVAIDALLHDDQIVYAGFSAAAVIASDDLKALTGASDPHEVPAGYDADIVWEGLGLLPFSLVVHVDSDHPESKAMDKEVAFHEACQRAYRTLRDGEVLVVDGDRTEVMGVPNSE